MEESDEELVAVESVKDSTESSKSQDPGGRGSSAEGIGKGAEQILAEPVANPVHASESESLKSAQSESLVEDLPKTLRPSAKALSGPSVKEFLLRLSLKGPMGTKKGNYRGFPFWCPWFLGNNNK